jgi:hypothetical protein
MPLLLAVLLAPLAASTAFAAEPEIDRPRARPQAVGAAHTLRSIPEACVRLEGMFTGSAADPYRFTVVRTAPHCQPRARFVDARKAGPSAAGGWLLNDRISVPSAACPSQLAVVEVWRKPGQAVAPELDAQGRARIYLGDAKQAAEGGQLAAISRFAATFKVEGGACR